MLDNNFCNYLEYEICKALKNLDNESVKGFWCDGVVLTEPEQYYSQSFINTKRQVFIKAFVGQTGQEEYELILKFGPKALSRYARDLDIQECIPTDEEERWFYIDTKRKKIEIQLR